MFALRSSLYRHKVISGIRGYCAFIFGLKTRWLIKQDMMTQLKQKKKTQTSICFTFCMWPLSSPFNLSLLKSNLNFQWHFSARGDFLAVVYILVHNSWYSRSSSNVVCKSFCLSVVFVAAIRHADKCCHILTDFQQHQNWQVNQTVNGFGSTIFKETIRTTERDWRCNWVLGSER